ncbi:C40 family peptidase [Streptomyces sp. NPDC002835]
MLLLVCAAGCAVPVLNALSAARSVPLAFGGEVSPDQGGAAPGIPVRMLAAYKGAVPQINAAVKGCKGMRWPILAGIARIESHHAASAAVTESGDIRPPILGPVLNGSGAGGNITAFPDTDGGRWDQDVRFERAVGPFQFLLATFKAFGRDGNKDGIVDPHNADDAAVSAGVYLCGNGRDLGDRGQLKKALFAYNRSDAYVADVLGWIDQYAAAADSGSDLSQVTGTVKTVLDAALAQRGVPYSWGGGNARGASAGICCSPGGQNGAAVVGFDCSGLTVYAFAQAGVTLPRTAAVQAGIGKRIPASAGVGALQPGDLVFYGYLPERSSTIHHVGIYLGNGKMVNAPRPGTSVRIDPVSAMPDYAGGARLL